MREARRLLISSLVLTGAAVVLGDVAAKADVTITNQTNETLVVARGWHVNGKVVYGGWKVIHNGDTELVYKGNETNIILCVLRQRLVNGKRVWEIPGNNSGKLDLEVTDDGFTCEQQGGGLNVWKFTDHATGQEFFKDNNNNWSVPGMFTIPFYVVPGNVNQVFDP